MGSGAAPTSCRYRGGPRIALIRRSLCSRPAKDILLVRLAGRAIFAGRGLPVSIITFVRHNCRQAISASFRRVTVVPVSFGIMAHLPFSTPIALEVHKFPQLMAWDLGGSRFVIVSDSKVGNTKSARDILKWGRSCEHWRQSPNDETLAMSGVFR
jgi:hypothetical protein